MIGMICGVCDDCDSTVLYLTNPPQVKCKRSGKLHFVTDHCDATSAQSEIIRCKDCKNSEHWYRDRRRCFLWSEEGVSVFNDGFCNYAERRTDADMRGEPMSDFGKDINVPNKDIVYRQDVEDMLQNALPSRGMWEIEGDVVKNTICETVADLMMDLGKLPPAQPEERTEERTETHACDCISRQAAIETIGILLEQSEDDEHDKTWNNAIRSSINAVKHHLPSTQPEPQWIPCSERLPDKTDDYLCSYSGCAVVDICEYDLDRNEWGFFYDGDWKVVSNVTAWMPLPEPYAERRQE